MIKKSVAILTAIIFLCCSCSYRGVLKSDFYQTPQSTTSKIPLTVAVDNEQRFKKVKFTGSIGRYSFDFKDGLINAVESALASIFGSFPNFVGTRR